MMVSPDQGVVDTIISTIGLLVCGDIQLLRMSGVYHRKPTENSHLRDRSEEHTSELQSLMRISYAVFCLKKKKKKNTNNQTNIDTKNTRVIRSNKTIKTQIIQQNNRRLQHIIIN